MEIFFGWPQKNEKLTGQLVSQETDHNHIDVTFATDNSTIALQLLTKEGGGEAHFSQKKCEYKGLRDIQIWSTILQLSSATIGSN